MSAASTGEGAAAAPALAGAFADALASVPPTDEEAERALVAHHGRLTKPPGSLGRLEGVGARLAGIAGQVPPPLPTPAAVAVFAGDHGVHAEGVTPWPQEVTAQMVANFLSGGAAVSVIARQMGAPVVVVDVGVSTPLPPVAGDATTPLGDLAGVAMDGRAHLVPARVRNGTRNLRVEDAMTPVEAGQALDVGTAVASALVAGGARCLVMGDMGIANTTPSAALLAAFSGRPASAVTGRGTGIDDDRLASKVAVVEAALERAGFRASPERAGSHPLQVLCALGGLEIAALAGFAVGGAARRVPVVVDGVIATAAAVTAVALSPNTRGYLSAGHRSTEPGSAVGLELLGLQPLLDLELRLGEGSGGCLALGLLEAAARIPREMATFDAAGVSEA